MPRIVLKAVASSVAILALSGCGARSSFFASSSTDSMGGVSGRVTLIACPGPVGADACPARPAPSVVITFKSLTTEHVETAKTDSTGAYSAMLRAGTYSVVVLGRTPGADLGSPAQPLCPPGIVANPVGCGPSKFLRPVEGPPQITVVAGRTTTADFTFTIPMV